MAKMKSVKSMPAFTHTGDMKNLRDTMQRSYSVSDAQETMRRLAHSAPILAFPGVGEKLRRFSRSYSRRSVANLAKVESDPLLDTTLDEPAYTVPLLLAVFCAVLSAFQFGWNSGVLNVPEKVIREDLGLNQFQWSVIVSIYCIGGLVGSYFGGGAAEQFGRKNFLLSTNAVFISGGLLQSLAFNSFMLSGGRFLMGLGCGGATAVVPLYLGEIAPANLRGAVGTLNQFACVVGILAANLFGKPLGGSPSWRLLVGLALVPSALQILFAPLMPESPRWLLAKKQTKKANEVLSRLRGTKQVDFDISVLDFSKDAEEEGGEKPSDMKLLFTRYRYALFVAVALQVAQQFSGINAVFYYSTSFFESAHVEDPWLGSVLASTVNVFFTGVAIYLMDRLGRRVLLLLSSMGMLISCIALTVGLYQSSKVLSVSTTLGYFLVSCMLAYVAFFELGLGPIPWLLVAEIFPSDVSSSAISISSAINWTSNFLVSLSFPFVHNYLGIWTFVPFAGVCGLSALITAEFVPETRGKTLRKILDELKSKAAEGADDDDDDDGLVNYMLEDEYK